MSLLLKKKKVLISREQTQAKTFANLIKKNGGIPLTVPLIKISCKDYMLSSLTFGKYEWIFFTSAHGVRCFMEKLRSLDEIRNIRIAAVGEKTAKKLEKYGLKVHFMPTTYNAETMVQEFFERYEKANHILVVRGNRSRNVLLEAFKSVNISFTPVVVYETKPNIQAKELLLHTIKNERPEVLTFTSPSTVNTFVQLLNDSIYLKEMRQLPVVCIGTTTERAARHHQFQLLITPKTFTIEAMIDELISFLNK